LEFDSKRYAKKGVQQSALKLATIKKMKILIATGVYPPESGGPATYTKLLEERLPALGFEVSVLPFSAVRHLPKLLRHTAYFLKCFLMALRADIVYAQDTVSVGFPAVLAAMFMRKKFLVRVPGDYAWEQGRQRFWVKDELDEFQNKKYGIQTEVLRKVQKFVVNRAVKIIVPSEYMKKIVSNWTNPEKITVIYSSIELPVSYEETKERPEGFLVVSTGRRVPWKGFEGLARVVAREKDWHLFIAENLPRAQALGWVKTANAFVLNSTYEGLSHALIEAMSLGTPIVATAVGGNPELIEDGVDGLLIPPSDDEALYGALKNIEMNKDAARARTESARAKIKRFSIDTTVTELTTLLKTI
jgi:glycosyltransferase involved in cell wall biosynthesis